MCIWVFSVACFLEGLGGIFWWGGRGGRWFFVRLFLVFVGGFICLNATIQNYAIDFAIAGDQFVPNM